METIATFRSVARAGQQLFFPSGFTVPSHKMGDALLISVTLFAPRGGARGDTWKTILEQNLARYEGWLLGADQTFLGLYRCDIEKFPGIRHESVAVAGSFAEFRLVDAPSVEEAMRREVAAPREPALADLLAKRAAWLDLAAAQRLWLVPLVVSPFSRSPVPLEGRLLHIILRHMPESRTLRELIEFDRRIVDSYSRHMAAAGWVHIAIYQVVGLPEFVYADTLDVIDAASPSEALAKDDAIGTTPEQTAIIEECNDYLDRSRERYQLWFEPLLLGGTARAGVCFHPNGSGD